MVTFYSFPMKVNGSCGEIRPRENITMSLDGRKELFAIPW